MLTFCVIPAYNEERTISKVVIAVSKYVDRVVVVDDASTDSTFAQAKQAGSIALRHLINRDQGAALQTGNEYALAHGADIIIHFDADGQFLADEIPDLISPIKNDCLDVVIGSRFLEKKSQIPWFKLNIIFPLARLINKIFLGIKLTDPQCGFRAMSAKSASLLVIEQDGKAHCSEILYKLTKNKLKYKEVAVTVIYHDFGQKFSSGLRIIKDLFFSRLIN